MKAQEQPWLAELNPAQRESVTHGNGPLLIVAGAGTGKTKTLACRVAHLIASGVPPQRILLLTFTRRAAAEMLKRAADMVGDASGAKVWGGTFHAVANRLLRMYAPAVGLLPEFTVMDDADAADLMNLIRGELGFGKGDRRFPRKETLVDIYSHTVNAHRPLREIMEAYFPWHAEDLDDIRPIFDAYVERKKTQHVLDYDDLLLFWSALCASPVGPRVAGRFEHILVDEYQDTNAIQAEILRGMRQGCDNITAVGDDAQAIYSFRAATIRNILDFPQHFPGARVVALEQNYRSTQPILRAANAVMEGAKERYTKELWSSREAGRKPALVTCIDEAEQTDAVCRHILEHREKGVPLMHQAVLFRAGHHSAMLEVELLRRNIPFHKYGGLKFLEAGHIKDVIALLRLLENPHDEVSWYRVLTWFERVGGSTARRIMGELGVRRMAPTGENALSSAPNTSTPLVRFLAASPTVPESAVAQIDSLRGAFAYCLGLELQGAGSTATDEPKPEYAQTSALSRQSERSEESPARGGSTELEILGCAQNDTPPAPLATDGNGTNREPQPTDRNDTNREPKPTSHLARRGLRRRSSEEPSLNRQLERLFQFYEPICREKYDNAPVRLRDLDQLMAIASRYRSRGRFITDLTLDPPQSTSDLAGPPYLDEDYLVLSTIHSAKGCEWDVVHILHAADGMIPSDMATGDEAGIDEERRLLYVALTRAKDMLYVYHPLRYYHRRFGQGDSHTFAQLSRFLSPQVKALFSSHAATFGPTDDSSAPASLPSPASPYSRVSRLWED